MERSAGDRRKSSGGRKPPAVERGGVDPASWVTLSESAMLESMKWFDVWLQGTQRFWSAGLRAFGPLGMPRPKDGQRRSSDLPWVPQLDAEVIPLRRKTDQPGAEATRISMRLPMPWTVGGADVISLEAIVGRRQAEARANEDSEPAEPPDQKRGG